MKTICQIGVIFGVCWVSEILESLLPFSFPASVIAMVLLLALLLAVLIFGVYGAGYDGTAFLYTQF